MIDLYDYIDQNIDSRKYMAAAVNHGGPNSYNAQELEISLLVRKDVDHCTFKLLNSAGDIIDFKDIPVNGADYVNTARGLYVYGFNTPGPGSDGGGWFHTEEWFNPSNAKQGPILIANTSQHNYAGRGDHYFSIRILGTVVPKISGEYTMTFGTLDDGAYITFDQLIGFNAWGNSGGGFVVAGTPIYLHAGQPYDLTFDYFDRGGERHFNFYWVTPTGAHESIGGNDETGIVIPERITSRPTYKYSVNDADTYTLLYDIWNDDGSIIAKEEIKLKVEDRTPPKITELRANVGISIKPFVDSKLKGPDIIINNNGTVVRAT